MVNQLDDFEGREGNTDQQGMLPVAELIRHMRVALFGQQAAIQVDIYQMVEPRTVAATLALVEAHVGEDLTVSQYAYNRLLEDPNLNNPHVIQALILGLMHPEEDVGSSCIAFMDLLQEADLPALEAALHYAYENSESPIQRVQLLWALNRSQSPETIKLLIRVLEEPAFTYEASYPGATTSGYTMLRSSYTPALRLLLDINTVEPRAAILRFLEANPDFKEEFLNHFYEPANKIKLPLFLEQSNKDSAFIQEVLEEAGKIKWSATEAE